MHAHVISYWSLKGSTVAWVFISQQLCTEICTGAPARKCADRQRHHGAQRRELCFEARPAVPASPRCERCWLRIPFRLSCLPNDFCFTALLDCVHQDGRLLKCQGTLNCCYLGEETFPMSPRSGGCIASKTVIREAFLVMYIAEGERGGWERGTDAGVGIYSSLSVLIKKILKCHLL